MRQVEEPLRARQGLRLLLPCSTILSCFLLSSCVPLLCTNRSTGVGAFWNVETHASGAVRLVRYEGLGLVVGSDGVFFGWIALESIEIDLEECPSGSASFGTLLVAWGQDADQVAERLPLDGFEQFRR